MNPVENCPRTETISAWVDNELDEAAHAELAAHVSSCVVCAPVMEEFRRLHAAFSALPAPGVDIDITERVDRHIAATVARPKTPSRAQRMRWWQGIPLALGGALSLSLGAYLGGMLVLGAQVTAPPTSQQMAAFTAIPPGALCPTRQICNPMER